MATGDITGLAIDTTGKQLSGTIENLAAATVDTLDQIIKLAVAGGNARTLAFRTFVSATDDAGNCDFVVSGLDPVLSGETVTATIPAASFTDDTNTSNVVSGGSVTNNSTATKDADALTVFAGAPIAAWATRDKTPIGASFNIDTGAGTVSIETETYFAFALHAVDNWAGVEWVDVQFQVDATYDAPTVVTADSEVSDQTGNLYRISARTLIDPFEDSNGSSGTSRYLFRLRVDLTSANNGDQYKVSEVTIRTKDGVDHTMIADGHLDTREVIVLKSGHDLRYLDADAAGTADGSSWTDAWTDLPDTGASSANLPSATNIVFCRAGTYTMPTNLRYGGSKWCRFIPVEAGVVFASGRDSNDTIGQYMQLGHVDAPEMTLDRTHATTTTTWRGDSSAWFGLENVHMQFASVAPAGNNGPQWTFTRPSHMSMVKVRQTKGFNGPVPSYASSTYATNILLWSYSITNSGTAFRVNAKWVLCVGLSANGCAVSTEFTGGTHFDGIHSGSSSVPLLYAIFDGPEFFDCGNIDETQNENIWLGSTGNTSVAFINPQYYSYTGSQQIIQVEGDVENVQIIGVGALDDEGASTQGINFSGNSASNPYEVNKVLFRNSYMNNIGQSDGGHASGLDPIDEATAVLLGPNLYSYGTGEAGASPLLTYSGSTPVGGASSIANAGFGLANLATNDLSPADDTLLDGTTAATATTDYPYDQNNVSMGSGDSYWFGPLMAAAPTITSVTPATGAQGATNLDLTIVCTGAIDGIAATFSGTGITVNSTTWVSATEVTVNIDIDGAATASARDAILTNPGLQAVTSVGAFLVLGPPSGASASAQAHVVDVTWDRLSDTDWGLATAGYEETEFFRYRVQASKDNTFATGVTESFVPSVNTSRAVVAQQGEFDPGYEPTYTEVARVQMPIAQDGETWYFRVSLVRLDGAGGIAYQGDWSSTVNVTYDDTNDREIFNDDVGGISVANPPDESAVLFEIEWLAGGSLGASAKAETYAGIDAATYQVGDSIPASIAAFVNTMTSGPLAAYGGAFGIGIRAYCGANSVIVDASNNYVVHYDLQGGRRDDDTAWASNGGGSSPGMLTPVELLNHAVGIADATDKARMLSLIDDFETELGSIVASIPTRIYVSYRGHVVNASGFGLLGAHGFQQFLDAGAYLELDVAGTAASTDPESLADTLEHTLADELDAVGRSYGFETVTKEASPFHSELPSRPKMGDVVAWSLMFDDAAYKTAKDAASGGPVDLLTGNGGGSFLNSGWADPNDLHAAYRMRVRITTSFNTYVAAGSDNAEKCERAFSVLKDLWTAFGSKVVGRVLNQAILASLDSNVVADYLEHVGWDAVGDPVAPQLLRVGTIGERFIR